MGAKKDKKNRERQARKDKKIKGIIAKKNDNPEIVMGKRGAGTKTERVGGKKKKKKVRPVSLRF